MNRVNLQAGLFSTAFLGVPLVALLTAGWWVGGAPEPSASPASPDVASAADHDLAGGTHDIAMAEPVPGPAPLTATLNRGRTLSGALRAMGLGDGETHGLVQALDGPLDLRRLPPQTSLRAIVDTDGRWQSLAIRAEADSFVRVRFDATGAVEAVEPTDLPVVTAVESTGGRVDSSVAQALADNPHGFLLTLAFAEVFQWDVDLLVDPRPGDQVRVVYEVDRVGPVPEDLPSFGSAPDQEGDFLAIRRVLAASYEGRMASSRAFWVETGEGEGDYFDEHGNALRKTFLKSPLNYRRISSKFSRGRMHPVLRKVVPHHGVDFAAATGTPVVSAADGRVSFTGWDGPLGRAIRVKHGSEYETVYGHLSRIAPGIRSGARVTQNQVIGYVGATGRATGPHLHYTMLQRGRPIDPLRFENPAVEPLPEGALPRLQQARQIWAPILASIPLPTQLAEARRGALPGA